MTEQPDQASSRAAGADRACPRCGTMRPAAATFCSNCGQDLRPGAPLGAMADRPARTVGPTARTPAPKAPAAPPQKAPLGGPEDAARPAGERAAGQRIISRPPGLAEDESASFTERYRGTEYETPESRVLGPPPSRRAGPRRFGRIAGALTLVVLVAALALAGASSFLLSGGNAPDDSNARATSSAGGASTSPGPTLVSGTTFDPTQRAQIAFCLSAAETGDLDTEIASLLALARGAQHAALAAASGELVGRLAEMRLAAGEMAGWSPLAAYAAVYDGALQAIAKAGLGLQAAAQAGVAKQEATAAAALAAAQRQLHAADPERAKLLAAEPTLSCSP